MAGSLPKTAAALLEWDYTHRAESPLPPKLRAKLRWITAHGNRCDYAKAYARADYVRAGGKAEDIDDLLRHLDKLPEAERLALQVMRQLAEAAYTITDRQMTELVKAHGEKQVAAMVLLSAYANCQDRLLLALGVTVEKDGPLPPVKVRFKKPPVSANAPPTKDAAAKKGNEVPKRTLTPPSKDPPPVPEKLDDPEWTALSMEKTRELMEEQKVRRQTRIRIPDAKEVQARLPPNMPQPEKQVLIIWYLVTFGYQPELTEAWSRTGRAFREDADMDRVFTGSLFWIVTRANMCFY
jgi:hypothetical protein